MPIPIRSHMRSISSGLAMTDLVEWSTYDDIDKKMIVTTRYDNSALLEQNAVERAERGNTYKGNFVRVANVHLGDIVRLKNMGYDLLSSDPAEVRRALCYIQSNEQKFLTVEGKPFAMNRVTWQ